MSVFESFQFRLWPSQRAKDPPWIHNQLSITSKQPAIGMYSVSTTKRLSLSYQTSFMNHDATNINVQVCKSLTLPKFVKVVYHQYHHLCPWESKSIIHAHVHMGVSVCISFSNPLFARPQTERAHRTFWRLTLRQREGTCNNATEARQAFKFALFSVISVEFVNKNATEATNEHANLKARLASVALLQVPSRCPRISRQNVDWATCGTPLRFLTF